MDKFLDDLFVVAFESPEGLAENGPINGIDGGVSSLVFVLVVYSVLLSGVCIPHILSDITVDDFIVDIECSSA